MNSFIRGSLIRRPGPCQGRRVALREYTSTSSTVYFLVANHLGSTRVVTQATGALVSELRYSAYGEQRFASGASPTDYRYTGQLSKIATVGLYHYGARWFDPQLAHFTQADTIVPGVYNPADWNRFAYVKYNPVKYNDPSGHASQDMNGPGCSDEICHVGAKIGASVYHVVKDINPKKISVTSGSPTLTEKMMQGDKAALVQLLIPSHIGGRVQLEGSFTIIIGVSVGVGVNVVYNRNSDELAANVDWAIEGGGGFGAGASGTGGLLVGWGSSSVEDATKGFSGIISGTVAAEAAASAAITAPIDEKGLHVDPYSGQVPPTVYIGGGAGGGYASLGGGVNGPSGIFKNLTLLLPWHWFR